jgi:hypothetical protein
MYTFVYDIGEVGTQLFYPFTIEHLKKNIKPYNGVFIGSRHIMPDGNISKWSINISAIFPFMKN